MSITLSTCAMGSEKAFGELSFSYNLPNRVTVKIGPDSGFWLHKRPSLDTYLKHREVD